MRLDIENFAKIKEAQILVDGITVIAGENNTGKSTVGKILFSIFNVLSDISEKISEEREKEIRQYLRISLRNIVDLISVSPAFSVNKRFQVVNVSVREIQNALKNLMQEQHISWEEIPKDDIEKIVEKNINRYRDTASETENEEYAAWVEKISQGIHEITSLEEEKIILESITRYFRKVFSSQINVRNKKVKKQAKAALHIQNKMDELVFEEDTCKSFLNEIAIMHHAIYIDNPFIVDELDRYNELNPMGELLKEYLESTRETIFEGVIQSVRAKEKLADIYSKIQSIVGGDIIVKENDQIYLRNTQDGEEIALSNLSTGMKSFVILKMLLENGTLKQKDVVVLDEPEIHLHPQWQIAYAELIVLLQKEFDLTVVVTTHSPYFVDAINLFSCKYGTNSKVNYYLSEQNGNGVSMNRVTDDIDQIYKKMASPINELETLRYELNNQ